MYAKESFNEWRDEIAVALGGVVDITLSQGGGWIDTEGKWLVKIHKHGSRKG